MPNAEGQVPNEIQLPGTQPQQIAQLDTAFNCLLCHGGYDNAVEPGHNWEGSMMAHAARDPVFWAALAVAEQDFAGSGDLCIRCHTPAGWLDGRSTPTNGSLLQSFADSDGVSCAVCHKLTNPDDSEHVGFHVPPFVANDGGAPKEGHYGSGQYVMWAGADFLGPYQNSPAFHFVKGSDYHRDSALCGTCHDVSNPAVGDLAPGHGSMVPLAAGKFDGTPGGPLAQKAGFQNPPYAYGAVERTFSEHQSSAFKDLAVGAYATLPADLQRGAIEDAYLAAVAVNPQANYEDGTTRTFSCQSCHMPPVTGFGDGVGGGPLRKDLPKHSLVGGNYWTPQAIQHLDAQGKLVLGGGLSGTQILAMNDGADRARDMLESAAALEVDGLTLKVFNLTGHKLFSGYPEGRRLWIRTRWYDAGDHLVREDGAYGDLTVTVAGQSVSVRSILDLDDPNLRIYHVKPAMTQDWAAKLLSPALGYSPLHALSYDRITGQVTHTLGQLGAAAPGTAYETQHFILNNTVLLDTRIPPYGFDYDEALRRSALPVPANSYGNPGPGGTYQYWDDVPLNRPAAAVRAEIELLYQPTSWEYIQFLLLANNQSDPFTQSTGQDLYDAWLATGMAEPHVMAQASWADPTHLWQDLGYGLAGSSGTPKLYGSGSLQPGSTVQLNLEQSLAGAPAHLIIGASSVPTPFLGGTLVPSPQIVIPNLPVSAQGKLTLGAPWPGGVPSGTSLFFQYLVSDPGAVFGVAQSNAISSTVP